MSKLNLLETRSQLAVINLMDTPKTFLRDTFFTKVEKFPTAKVDVDIKKGHRKMAPYVHERIGGKLVENTGFYTETYQPPLVGPHTVTTAFDLMMRTAGESTSGGMTPEERGKKKFLEDSLMLEEMITRREEYMCAQAIFEGKIDVVGEGLNHVIDFNHTNRETLSGKKLWSDPTSQPLGDIKRWVRQVQITGFVNVDTMIMASDVVDEFLRHPDIKEMLDVRKYSLGEMSPRQLPSGVTYIGTLTREGIDIYEYNEHFLDDFTDEKNPKMKPLVPAGTVALLNSRADYARLYAAVTIADDKSNALVTYEETRVPSQWVERNPARQMYQLNAKPLMVPTQADSWFVAHVLEA